jgi:nitrogen fixation protein FixH
MSGARLRSLVPRGDAARALYWLVGGFAIVLAVNGLFVYLALASWNGLVTDNAYERGLAYNRTLAQVRAEAARGWRIEIDYAEGMAAVRVRDAEGRALNGLDVEVRFVRPTHEGYDSTIALAGRGEGRYAAAAPLPLPGQWDMLVVARDREGPVHASRRVVVR